MRGDGEPDSFVHEARFEEGDQAVGVGVVSRIACRLEFHHGHAAPGLLIDNLNGKVMAGGREGWFC